MDIGNSNRIHTPEETLERARPLFRQVGLTRLGNITGLDRVGLPVTVAFRPNSFSLAQSSGKGTTLAAAMTSAAMEAIELDFAENIRLERVQASLNELQGKVATLPVEQMYLSRYSLFQPHVPEEWLMGWDVVAQEEVAVPFHSVSLDFRVLNELRCRASFTMDSNGLASGNYFLEAVLSALLEVIERDGVACHSEAERYGHKKTRIQLDTIEDEVVQGLLHHLRTVGLVPVIMDCTTDIGVPVYEAFLYDSESNLVSMSHGYGAHLNPVTAVLRALTEAVQARTLIISGARDDLFRDVYLANRLRHKASVQAVNRAHQEVRFDPRDRSLPSFHQDIAQIIEGLKRVGLSRVVVLDLSPPGAPISVVRVVVPGLEGYYYYGYNPRERCRKFVASVCGQSRGPDGPRVSSHRPAGGVL